MKIRFLRSIVIALAALLFNSALSAHDVPVHMLITQNAAATALSYSFGYNNFLNLVASDNFSATNASLYLITGSAREDDKDADGGGKRSLNHFYDPLTGNGLSDLPTDRYGITGTNSFSWASKSNCLGYNFYGDTWFKLGANLGTSNNYSWQNARGDEWDALTATNRAVRAQSLAHMYRALGQVIHLLEDTTQPQHVRNEQHLDEFGLGFDTPWRSHFEDYGNEHRTNLNYTHAILNWRTLGFTNLHSFWDRHLYNGSAAALDADANGGTQLGLAEFSNGNFLGERHMYGEFFKPGDIEYYPYPSILYGTDYLKKRSALWPPAEPVIFSELGGREGYGVYLNKVNQGVSVPHHCRLNYWALKYPDNLKAGAASIVDDSVDEQYLNILIPKAVKYSAGLLDYFFRGNMTVLVNGTTMTIRNTSGQDFDGGTFTLLRDDSQGNRTNVDEWPTYSPLLKNATITFTESDFSLTDTNTRYMLLYQGTIGLDGAGNAQDPVDQSYAIAVANFTNTATGNFCEGAPVNLTGLDWHASPNVYTLLAPDNFSGAGTSFSFSSGFSAAANLNNPSDCDVTVTISAHFEDTGPYGALACFTYGMEGDPYIPWAAQYGWGAWSDLEYSYPETDNPNPTFYVTIPAHSVYPLYIEAYGIVGWLSLSY